MAENMDDCGWLYLENRTCDEYLKGVNLFIEAVVDDMKGDEEECIVLPLLGLQKYKEVFSSNAF